MIEARPQFPQFFDLDGSPLEDGCVYVGTVNTNPETSPISVYWDEAGTQPAAQPMRTRAGSAVRGDTISRFFVASFDYSITVKDKQGRLVWYSPSVQFGPSSSMAYQYPAIGSIVRSVESRLTDRVSVKDFGAVGDGLADDTAKIQAAVDSIGSDGGTVHFPPGTYKITSTINFGTKPNVRLVGSSGGGFRASVASSRIVTTDAIWMLSFGSAATTTSSGPVIENLGFYDQGGIALGGISFYRENHLRITNCAFETFTVGTAVLIDGTGDGAILPIIYGSQFRYSKEGIRTVSNGVTGMQVIGGYFVQSSAAPIPGSVGIQYSGDTLFAHTAIDNHPIGISLVPSPANSGAGNRVIGSRFEKNDIAIQTTGAGRSIISGNMFVGDSAKMQVGVELNGVKSSYPIISDNSYYDLMGGFIVDNTGVVSTPRAFIDYSEGTVTLERGGTGDYDFSIQHNVQVAGRDCHYFARAGRGDVVGLFGTNYQATSTVQVGATTDHALELLVSNDVVAKFMRDASTGAGKAALMLKVNKGGGVTFEQVTVGAVDSGGVGYRVLRVPN